MGLQRLLDDDAEPGNRRRGILSGSEREDIETAICLIDHMDAVFKVLRERDAFWQSCAGIDVDPRLIGERNERRGAKP